MPYGNITDSREGACRGSSWRGHGPSTACYSSTLHFDGSDMEAHDTAVAMSCGIAKRKWVVSQHPRILPRRQVYSAHRLGYVVCGPRNPAAATCDLKKTVLH